MQFLDGRIVYSASDINDFSECRHLTELERRVAAGETKAPEPDESDARARRLLARKGDEHERRYLERLRAAGSSIVELPPRIDGDQHLERLRRLTVEALDAGPQYIYQPTFFDGTFLGRADFLRRVERPCAARAWSYEVIDTKLARSTKAYFLLQLSAYSLQLAALQGGTVPDRMHVALGSGEERSFKTRDYLAYFRCLRKSFLDSVNERTDAYPFECGHCTVCAWSAACERQRRSDDHLSLVAWMRRDQVEKLEAAGIGTLAALAVAGDSARPFGFNAATFDNLRLQASLQFAQRREGYKYHLLDHCESEGLATLPAPDRGDVYFDMEGDPYYAPDGGLEYLFGAYLPDEDRYIAFWALSAAEEKRAVTEFIDFLLERRARFPEMHVYHYANYEKAALGRLTLRYAVRRDELDDLLRSGTFVDLFTVVRQGLRISQESYSIKKLEPFYGFERSGSLKRGDDSILLFEDWLDSGDESILETIRHYNDEDCRSTLALHRWLLERRAELAAAGGIEIPWFAPQPKVETPPAISEMHAAMNDARARVLAGLEAPDERTFRAFSEADRVRWLIGNAVDYHWNDSKPGWWRFHERCANVDQLIEFDSEAIGGLRLRDDVAPYKQKPRDQNLVYTFEFPEQQHHLGDDPVDPDTKEGAGKIVAIDEERNRLELKVARKVDPTALRALVPKKPQETRVLQLALIDVGNAFADGTLNATHPAIVELLRGAAPRFVDGARARVQPNRVDGASLAETIGALDRSYLVVQGPPGSGKSTTGGEAVARLLGAGLRVGIMARSHNAAQNFVHAVEHAAHELGIAFAGIYKDRAESEDPFVSRLARPFVRSTADNADPLDPANRLVAGTPWVFSRPDLASAFDVLAIDEAGQIALADAIACARSARNLVLLGDPLQLAQVSQGSHPPGIGRSVLEHALGDDVTIPPDRGVFLPHSWRMHPGICSFISDAVYEGRLSSVEGNERNAVDSPGLRGSGLRWMPVEHRDNRRSSDEEAAAIVAAIAQLRQGTFTLRNAPARPIEDSDIMIVSPYNAQRALLTRRLADAGFTGVRVGTVDKFQGQQSPVVFYSMATSSGQDIPRTMEFLFERNRFNVAISRAQCLSILVCSPELLRVSCRTPEQMALANLLCEYCERADYFDGVAVESHTSPFAV